MKKKANLYEIELTEQLAHKDYQWRVYMDMDEILVSSPIYRFQAVNIAHAIELIRTTQYKGNIKRVSNGK